MLQNAVYALVLAQEIQSVVPKTYLPPSDGTKADSDQIIPRSMVKNTRGYLEKVCNQINGCYEKGWFDSCAVMMRRFLETLIIEVYEHYQIDQKIKNQNGDFLFLKDMINNVINDSTWNLGRNTKLALPKLKTLGDMSAHGRRYNAHREDIDKLASDFRVVCQELLYLANLK